MTSLVNSEALGLFHMTSNNKTVMQNFGVNMQGALWFMGLEN